MNPSLEDDEKGELVVLGSLEGNAAYASNPQDMSSEEFGKNVTI